MHLLLAVIDKASERLTGGLGASPSVAFPFITGYQRNVFQFPDIYFRESPFLPLTYYWGIFFDLYERFFNLKKDYCVPSKEGRQTESRHQPLAHVAPR